MTTLMAEQRVWQPIETAPKDGTPVLLYPHYDVSSWDEEIGYFTDWDSAAEEMVRSKIEFTHWMRLPDPPQVGLRGYDPETGVGAPYES